MALLAVVVIALGPGTFLRTNTGLRSDPVKHIAIDRVDLGPPPPGLLRLTGSWRMTSEHGWFGGFSSLVSGPGRTLFAATDRGFLLGLDLAGDRPRAIPGSFRFVGVPGRGRREYVDMEAITRNPATGTLWASFENDNLVMRFPPDGTRTVYVVQEVVDKDGFLRLAGETRQRQVKNRRGRLHYFLIGRPDHDVEGVRHRVLLGDQPAQVVQGIADDGGFVAAA